MNKSVTYILVFLFLGGTARVFAQQQWQGKLVQDTKWSGEIRVVGDIIVPPGVSLTIEPGTKIIIDPQTDATSSGKDKSKVEIYVFGSIVASGNPANKITFTSAASQPQMADWYGIILKNKDGTNIFNNVIVEYAYVGITLQNCFATIRNSVFRFNYHAGVSAELRSRAVIKNCIFTGNDYSGIKCEYGAEPVISETIITQNSHGVIIFNEGLPVLGKVEANNEVKGGYNQIYENYDYNIYNHTANPIYAQVNEWGEGSPAEIKKTIFDNANGPQYGEVIISPTRKEFEKILATAARATRTQREAPSQQQTATVSQPQVTNPPAGRPKELPNTALNASQQTKTDQLAQKTENQMPKDVTISPNTQNSAQNKQETVLAENKNPVEKSESPTTENQPAPSKEEKAEESSEESTKQIAAQEDPREEYWSLKKPIFEYSLDKKPERIKYTPPKYPAGITTGGRTVRVFVKLVIGVDGKVESAQILRVEGRSEFGDAVLEAVKNYVYTPGTFQGKPVKYIRTERFDFK